MEGTVKIEGLDSALAAMRAAFPIAPKQQARLLNSAMRTAAERSIVPIAKSLALTGDSSGALSESIGVRFQSAVKRRARGVAAGVEVVPVRFNVRAIAMYIQHYYTDRGKTASINLVAAGIRHGHLIEFGTVRTAARPFLWPAGQSGKSGFTNKFSKILKKRIEAAVKRRARRRK